ncbi:hypothetical protein [Lactobacillus intestinalis]|uniref:hypothetical protein n=1 Tax=Lactobacillus intestinalis TaxID=151781 RepID=UPI0025B14054|nr:hypothetical protein [Lactobacillus intestinalis]
MKNRVKYILAFVFSVFCIGLLIFAEYLQISEHRYKGLGWYALAIIVLIISAFLYLRNAIKNTSIADLNNAEDNDPDLKLLETNSKTKSLDFISNLSFWGGMILMIYASHQLKDDPQFSYILFAISGTLTIIWLTTLVAQLFYIVKYGRKLDDTEK